MASLIQARDPLAEWIAKFELSTSASYLRK